MTEPLDPADLALATYIIDNTRLIADSEGLQEELQQDIAEAIGAWRKSQ